MDGASSTSKRVADAIIKEAVSAAGKASTNAVNTVIDSVVNKVKKRSHPIQQPHELKRRKIDIDSLIDGSGIVYD